MENKEYKDYKEYAFAAVETKWQQAWKEAKLFEAHPDARKKFFLNFPYPYVNAYPHIGHFFTLMRVEAFARYKRLSGYNVLFPQGWHATGSPIVQAAKRVKQREPKMIKIMEDMGFTETDFKKFEEPKYWITFFAPEFKKDFESMGLSIDWRREFYTTSLNPYYDKFVQWQFRKLKKKKYVIKGKFPVVWDPKEHVPVGDHDRVQGEGEVPQEFALVKHQLGDHRYLVSATLRPDTILGITNLYVHPDITYIEAEVHHERWILSENAAKGLEQQEYTIKRIGTVSGKDLIGKKTKEFNGREVLILPATFLSPDIGTGLVHSVPSESADDLIALQDLQKNEQLCKRYGININEVKAIKPIPILNTPGVGTNPAQAMLDKYHITTQNERGKLDAIRNELYKLSYYTATFTDLYKKWFSRDLTGMKISEGKELIKQELIKKGWAAMYYELTGKVVSRSLTPCIVKIVSDQWFIDYNNKQWKQQAKICLGKLSLYPEKARQQFDYVIDWLRAWACTREEGLGTRLPWDEKWLIESLSDSTIYMAYYTIVPHFATISLDHVDDNLFDYVFLGKKTIVAGDCTLAERMKQEFNYWYSVDFRNSGKDLIQNHLTFFIFNHTAIFKKKHWPKGIGVNGWVTVDGQKMSKSLGNMILVRDMAKRFGADASRFTILSGGEGLDDPNWETKMAESLSQKFHQLLNFAKEHYNQGRTKKMPVDAWMESQLHLTIKEVTEAMEQTLFRTAIKKTFFDIQRDLRWYLRRCNNKPHQHIMNAVIEAQLVMLSPFIPHVCEEAWQLIGKTGFIAQAKWPKTQHKKILDYDPERLLQHVMEDLTYVMNITNIKQPKEINLYLAEPWKYELYHHLYPLFEKTRNPKEIFKELLKTPLKAHASQIQTILPKLLKQGYIPDCKTQHQEYEALLNAQPFLHQEYKADIIIHQEAPSVPKAQQALPGKPAILLT